MRRRNPYRDLEPELDQATKVQITVSGDLAKSLTGICSRTGERHADAVKRLLHLAAHDEMKRFSGRAA
jgi:hypothetical protein